MDMSEQQQNLRLLLLAALLLWRQLRYAIAGLGSSSNFARRCGRWVLAAVVVLASWWVACTFSCSHQGS